MSVETEVRGPVEPKPFRRVPGPLVVLLMALFIATVVYLIYHVAQSVAGPGKLERGRPTFDGSGK